VANLTRADGDAFFEVAAEVPLQIAVRSFRLEEAEAALEELRAGRITGAAVLVP
jgi:propanol-preferring alcohol dehydrogenase